VNGRGTGLRQRHDGCLHIAPCLDHRAVDQVLRVSRGGAHAFMHCSTCMACARVWRDMHKKAHMIMDTFEGVEDIPPSNAS